MNDLRISTYGAPRWGARVVGAVTVRKDSQARYYVDNVCVADMRVVGLFTIVTCLDATTHNVLTAFLRLIDREMSANETEPAHSAGSRSSSSA